MNHPPPQITPSIWREMVEKWANPNWLEISDKNKKNREKSELATTSDSAPLAKYRYEEDKNWASSKAKDLHDGIIEADAAKVSQGEEPNRFSIYQEVIGPQHHKRVLGMGHGMSSRLGVRLLESFDMDNDESDEETTDETNAA
ncbi:unnamed protein product [Linum trigynum]|uniref:Uncharacterized protein n=1 Tax=Linum trigynum TaxID=586398 RepID=A0AAV2CZN5_9ROSI